MREIEHHRSHHTSRSKSRDRDYDKSYYTKKRRSKSRSRVSRTKKKRSKRRRYRRSSSSSNSSSRSRGSGKSSASVIHRSAQAHSSEEILPSGHILKDANLTSYNVPNKSTIDEIEDDSFTAKTFLKTAASKKLHEKVVIDLKNDTIIVEGKVDDIHPGQSQLFHANFIGDDTRKVEKWIKKLFNYRQKAFQE